MEAPRLPVSPSPPTGTAPSTAPTAPLSPARGGRSATTTWTGYRGRELSEGWLHGLAVFDDRRAHAGDALVPTADGKMCTTGVAAQVIQDGTGQLAYSAIWGNLIGFDLNTPVSARADGGVDGGTGAGADGGADAGMIDKGNYDAVARGITGFAFDIEGSFSSAARRVSTEGKWSTPPTGRAPRWISRPSDPKGTTRSTGRRWAVRSTSRRRRRSIRASSRGQVSRHRATCSRPRRTATASRTS